MRSTNGWLLIGVLALAVVATGTALRAESATEAPVCAVPPALDGGASGAADQANGPTDEPGQQSVCNAQCYDGSYVTCWGTSCYAYDANCSGSSTFRGYCWGSSTGYRYCPTCPPTCSSPCSATVTCENGTKLHCDGCDGDCYSFYQCYVYCDGEYTFCPDLGGRICPI